MVGVDEEQRIGGGCRARVGRRISVKQPRQSGNRRAALDEVDQPHVLADPG